MLGSSGKVPAPNGQPVTVNGLASPLTVTAGPTDGDPLTINFAGATFVTKDKQCKQKKFAKGTRDIDCKLKC